MAQIPTPAARPVRAPRIPLGERWLLAGLIVIALVPSVAGSARVGGIASADPDTPERFSADPVPVVLHIVGALIYSLVGAFQFLPTLRRRSPAWHRFAGRYLLIPAGLLVAVTGIWMNAAYRFPAWDGSALLVSRYAVGVGMAICLLLGIVQVARRRFASHGEWMIRAYAIAMGAGTQVLTSMPGLLLGGEPDVLRRVIEMDLGWLINLVIAEVAIRALHRRSPRPTGGMTTPAEAAR